MTKDRRLAVLALTLLGCGGEAEQDCSSFDLDALGQGSTPDDQVVASTDRALEVCRTFVGTLVVSSVSDTRELALPVLREVTGSLELDGPFGVGGGMLAFEALEAVGDDLRVRSVSGPLEVSAPQLASLNANGGFEGGVVAITADQDRVAVDLPALAVADSLELTGHVAFNGEAEVLSLTGLEQLRGQSNGLTGLALTSTRFTAVDVDGLRLGDDEDDAAIYAVLNDRLERIELDLDAGSRVGRVALSSNRVLASVALSGVASIGSLTVTDCPALDPCDVRALVALADSVTPDSETGEACAEDP